MNRILIVEDEAHIAKGLQFNLQAEGYDSVILETGEDALELLCGPNNIDAVILDVMLPGKDGFTVATELRAAQNYVPILMLTARGRPEDVLKGFEAGTDDYLPKPFNLSILIARLQSLLRRKVWARAASVGDSQRSELRTAAPDTYSFDGNTIDFGALELKVGKNAYQLTVMEAELLRYLIKNTGRPVSRKAILEDVWGLHEDTDTRAIDNFIVRLRKYIEPVPANPRHLLTVRGVGYKFVADPT